MKSVGFSVLVVFGLMCSSAFADEVYQLSVPEHGCTTDCIPADTVKVDVDLTSSNTATVTFTTENSLYGIDIAYLSINGSATVTDDKYTPVGGSQITNNPPVDIATAQGLDNYGTFSVSFQPPGHDASSAVLDLHLTSGSWSSAANVLIQDVSTYNSGFYPGTGGFYASAQIRINSCASGEPGCDSDNIGSNGTAGDSAADLGTVSTVPEPTSAVLFGSVMILVGGAVRKRLAR